MKIPIIVAIALLLTCSGRSVASDDTAKAGSSTTAHTSIWDVSNYSGFATGRGYLPAYPAQKDFTNYPAFSWDKVPRWLAVRSTAPLGPAQLRNLADHYQIVMFEKSNSQGQGSTEAGTRWAARELKQLNPAIKTLFYWNTVVFYGGYAANAAFRPDDWCEYTLKADGTKEYRLIRDRLRTFNHDVPAMQQWWLDTALGMVRDANIDGLLLDKVGGGGESLVNERDELKGSSSYVNTLIELSRRMPGGKLLLGNTLRNERPNGNREIMRISNGSYLERWRLPARGTKPRQSEAEAICVSIQLMREALAKGKIIMLQSGPLADEATVTDGTASGRFASGVDFPLAVFLIAAEEHAYFSYQGSVNALDAQWKWDSSDIEKLNRPLGRPLGKPGKNGHVFTRSFEHVDVRVNVETKQTWFNYNDARAKPSTEPNLRRLISISGGER